jgi:leucyl aminopeptidase (aminopeptidase T)
VRTNYRQWSNNLNVDFDLTVKESEFPAEPTRDFEQIHQHSYREMKEEMENAIRILKMTDEETVSTSTYNAIARYL